MSNISDRAGKAADLFRRAGGATRLVHVTGWAPLAAAVPGDTFTLHPGTQGAEGRGVYFSEGTPRLTAAEGAARSGVAALVVILADSPAGWWRTAPWIVRKFGRPRTWHSDGKDVACMVVRREDHPGVPPVLHCAWRWGP